MYSNGSTLNLTNLEVEHTRTFFRHLLRFSLPRLLDRATERTAGGAEVVQEIEGSHRLPLLLPVPDEEVGPADDGRPGEGHRRPHDRQLRPRRVGCK